MPNGEPSLGVDGCRAGWICIGLRKSGEWSVELIARTQALVSALGLARLTLVDIPIGLLNVGREERLCDRAARALLGRPRAASVFRAPARPAFGGHDYCEANALNRRATGVGLSRQCFGVMEKIRQVDGLLREQPHLRTRLRESHPEICFQALNGGHAMVHNKKTRAGRAERRNILAARLSQTDAIIETALARYRRAQVAPDDVLDALVLAVTARLVTSDADRLCTLPADPPRDAYGLRMEMVYTRP